MFVATETARDGWQLARQMSRGEVRAASVAWATADEVAAQRVSPEPTDAERRDRPEQDTAKANTPRTSRKPDPASMATPIPDTRPASTSTPRDGWLIPPYADPTGGNRDSLGRGVTPGEVAAVVAADKRVQLEREAHWSYLQGAYKDPYAARATLDDLVKREGWTSAASRIAREPGQLGELRGKTGWLASGAAKQERTQAERAAGVLPGSLQRIGDAEGAAERTYRASVDAQRAADRTGVPRLSADAEAALAALRAAPDDAARGKVWQDVERNDAIASEIGGFRAAVEGRFGAEGVRQMLRAEGRAGAVSAPSVRAGHRGALDQVAERISTLWSGERAGSDLARRQSESERLTQWRGMRT